MPVLHVTRHRHQPIDTTRKTDSPKVHEKGRPCNRCGLPLSIYNGGKTCHPCQDTMRAERLGYLRSNEHVSYRRLMEEP